MESHNQVEKNEHPAEKRPLSSASCPQSCADGFGPPSRYEAVSTHIESFFEKILFASRWLLCPLYLGLALLLVLFSIYFFRELAHIAIRGVALKETDLIVGALTLVDLTLAAGLVVMVMLSGYENFVSKLDVRDAEKSIAWLGKLDTGSLKLKLSASIVTISAVQLLKVFMEIDLVSTTKLLWSVVIHLTFVASALFLTLMDRLVGTSARH
jgi:uncharacterized protein (TIGR00645 family)